MNMLRGATESLSWLMGGKLSKDKSCLSLMDFVITAPVADTLKVFPVIWNTYKALETTNQSKNNSFVS